MEPGTDVLCQVLIGTRRNYRRCNLPGTRHEGHIVCLFHREYIVVRDRWPLPFTYGDLPVFDDVQRRRR